MKTKRKGKKSGKNVNVRVHVGPAAYKGFQAEACSTTGSAAMSPDGKWRPPVCAKANDNTARKAVGRALVILGRKLGGR